METKNREVEGGLPVIIKKNLYLKTGTHKSLEYKCD